MSNRAIAEKHTDNIYDREILYGMLFFQEKANVKLDDGPAYVPLPYSYWIKRLPASRSTIRKSLNRLRKADLIETKKTRRHGRVALMLRLGRKVSKGCEGTYPKVAGEPIGRLLENQFIEEDNKKEKNKMTNNCSEPLGFMERPGKKVDIKVNIDKGDIASLPVSFDNARKVWATYWHSKYEGPVDGFPASKKMRAMFKQWVAKVPEEHNPLQLIARAVGNWPEFRELVKHRTGKGMPGRPQLAQVFYHLSTLLDVTDPEPKTAKHVPMKGGEHMENVLAKLIEEHNSDAFKHKIK